MNIIKMLVSMIIFGSVGIVVDAIPLSRPMTAGLRAFIGAAVMAVVMIARRKPIGRNAIKKNLVWLLLSGAALSANWILLFESYDYTDSVALSTVCYYMAPVIIMLLSPLFLKERLSAVRVVCILTAVAGTVLLSVPELSFTASEPLIGIGLALGAAALYAAVVLMNKRIKNLPAQETTFCQLAAAAVITLPYALFTQTDTFTFTWQSVTPMLILGVVHTGLAYMLFFGAAGKLPAQSTALMSYLDPAVAVILSAAVLGQWITDPFQIAGAVLILGAAFVGEVFGTSRRKRG